MAPSSTSYSTQDIIVLVYFKSRGVQYRPISDLLLQKGSKVSRSQDSLSVKWSRMTKKQKEEGGLAMYDPRTNAWNLQVTDQWLVDRMKVCAKEWAVADGKNETEAPWYYNRVKALTDVGPEEEEAIARYQEKSLDSIKQKLPLTVEVPASPATMTTAD